MYIADRFDFWMLCGGSFFELSAERISLARARILVGEQLGALKSAMTNIKALPVINHELGLNLPSCFSTLSVKEGDEILVAQPVDPEEPQSELKYWFVKVK